MHFLKRAGRGYQQHRRAVYPPWYWPTLLLCVSLCLPAVTWAQQLPLRTYGQQDGLGNLAVTAMARDQQGALWVGTQNGLFRYDGDSFERYGLAEGLADPGVTALLVDRDNRLWVGTASQLFQLQDGRLRPVLRGGQDKVPIWPAQSLAAAPAGPAYVVSERRVYALAPGPAATQLQPVFSAAQIGQTPALAQINSLYPEDGGQLWLGCGLALCQLGPAGLVRWGHAQGVPEEKWYAILRDRAGQLWARSTQHVIVLSAGAARFTDRTPAHAALRNEALRRLLLEDDEGRVLANVDDGLLRWQPGGWQRFDTANNLRPGAGINALQLDQDGELWLGTLGMGMLHWQGYDNWENWTRTQGLPDDAVLAFAGTAAGRLYAGTRSGLVSLAPGARRFTATAPGQPPDKWIAVVADGAGQGWAASVSGRLARIDAGGRATALPGRLRGPYAMLVDPRQRLWILSDDGLSRLDTRHPPPAIGPALLVRPAQEDQHDFALCHDGGATLWVMGIQRLQRLADGQWQSYPPSAQLGGTELAALACGADGTLWVGDMLGRLWQVHQGTAGLHWQLVAPPLLENASIIGLYQDRRGWLWVGTDGGVAVWNRQHWRFFNQADGLAWNDVNGSVFHEAPDGAMWIATSNGASRVRRPELLFAQQRLGVQIERARRDQLSLTSGADWQLPSSTAPLALELSSQLFRNRTQLRFHYRLAGLETAWTSSATPGVRYAALPPGDYRFEYYASNPARHSVTALQTQALTVLAPWWRTTPFYLLSMSLGLCLLAALYRLRVRHLLRRQLFTEQLVRERTRELEQSREQLRQRALRDSLTGAWNRGAVLELAERALLQAQADQAPLLLVLLDLDHFKQVNDRHGHAAGDAVLREAVARLGAAVRQDDAVGRYGGEEFLLLLPGLDQQSGAARVDQLRQVLRGAPVCTGAGLAITVTGSFGAAAFQPSRPLPLMALIERADQALYRAKERGRDRIEYAPPA